jgi:hypothetical protein
MNRLYLAIAVWLGFGLLLLIGGKVKAEQPVRIVVTLTCEDVQALVAWKGWQVIESPVLGSKLTKDLTMAQYRTTLEKN